MRALFPVVISRCNICPARTQTLLQIGATAINVAAIRNARETVSEATP